MKVNTASHFDPAKLQFPVYASPKMDGIRAYVKDRVVLSRSNKPIPNTHVQLLLGRAMFEGLDGELCAGNPWDKNLMQQCTSAFMSYDGEPTFTYQVFDIWNHNGEYELRLKLLSEALLGISQKEWSAEACNVGIRLVEQKLMRDMKELEAYEQEKLARGYEGIMLRSPRGIYKQGKSTVREGGLLKVKRYTDSEMRISAFEEQMRNDNEAFIDETGRTKRSSHQANKTGKNTLGVIVGTDVHTGQNVRLGTGFDDTLRERVWSAQEQYLGKIVTYKHFAHGVKDGIRHGVFLNFRDERDMD